MMTPRQIDYAIFKIRTLQFSGISPLWKANPLAGGKAAAADGKPQWEASASREAIPKMGLRPTPWACWYRAVRARQRLLKSLHGNRWVCTSDYVFFCLLVFVFFFFHASNLGSWQMARCLWCCVNWIILHVLSSWILSLPWTRKCLPHQQCDEDRSTATL